MRRAYRRRLRGRRLLHLRENTTVELRGEQLSLDRAALEWDEAYLEHVFDLPCELADAVERAGGEP